MSIIIIYDPEKYGAKGILPFNKAAAEARDGNINGIIPVGPDFGGDVPTPVFNFVFLDGNNATFLDSNNWKFLNI